MVSMGVSAVLSGPPPLMVSGHTAPDGTFMLPGVPPGPYVLQASVSPELRFVGPDQTIDMIRAGEFASVPMVVGGADVAGVTITTGLGGELEGVFVRDPATIQPLPEGMSVQVRNATNHNGQSRLFGRVAGTFRMTGLRGPVFVEVTGLPEGWALTSVVIDGGIDVTDQAIEAKNGQTVHAAFMLTDRVTEIRGTVSSASAADTGRRDESVVVFAADPAKWQYPSRHLRTVRADEQGAFRITALPPDERYLAMAVDYLEEGEGSDPEFLERMRDRATPFTLANGERRTVDLRVIER
jgi:hypothetical protein